jgi:ATP synthase protein I
LLLFLLFGIIAGFRNIYVLTARELKRQQQEDNQKNSP